jgi:hypothetical protein
MVEGFEPTGTGFDSAFGIQIILFGFMRVVNDSIIPYQQTFTGVVGFRGFNAGAATIEEAFVVGAGTPSVDPIPDGFSSTIENGGSARAGYGRRTPAAVFLAPSGAFTLARAAFAGDAVCPPALSVASCRYGTGTMSGEFVFVARNPSLPADSVVQPRSNFTDLPAVRITIVQ